MAAMPPPIRPERSAGRSLVALRTSGSRRPLFFVHALFGQVFQYYMLASYLGDDQPCYGLEAPGLWHDAPPLDSFEAMAHQYVQEMREVQPAGPYLVLGFSAGGRIAWEMAQQLRREGEEVFVGLLDSTAPGARWRKPGLYHRLMRPFVSIVFPFRVMAPLPLKGKRAVIRTTFRWQVGKLVSRLGLTLDSSIVRAAIRTGRKAPAGSIEVVKAILKAHQAYQLRPYDGPVTVFRARLQDAGLAYRPDLGWGPLAPRGVEVVEVPGNHAYTLTAPHVRSLAREVAAWADRSLPTAGASPTAEAPAVRAADRARVGRA